MQGHKVMFVQRFRGREMAFQDIGLERLKEIAEGLEDIAKLETPPRQQGRQMSMIMSPDRPKIEAIKRKEEAAKQKDAAESAKPADGGDDAPNAGNDDNASSNAAVEETTNA
jgi:translation initiation factor IF-3